jgi:hypothetical protein
MEKAGLYDLASKTKIHGIGGGTEVEIINKTRKALFDAAGKSGDNKLADTYNSRFNLTNKVRTDFHDVGKVYPAADPAKHWGIISE